MADIRDLPREYPGKSPFAQRPIQDKFDKLENSENDESDSSGSDTLIETDGGNPPNPQPVHEWLRGALTLLILTIALALAWLGNRLPAAAPENAPATEFSAARAMHDVRAIATDPHPIGSAEIAATRQYLLSRMTALDLDPVLRDQTVVVTRRNSADAAIGGRVQNIVGTLKGSDPTLPAVLLMAHYDTAPLSPGAGDDTAGVAVALEVARALKAGGPLRRSVIFLMTDGEEAGLLGANAFFESDPLRDRAGLIVNLEARGDSGRALMFQTGNNNRPLVEAYRRNAATPASDSLMVTIYKQMPNDTDLTAALERDYAGMNFAFVGHQMAYHTPLSTAASLNPGSVQHMGEQILPLLRDFAQAKTLGRGSGDMVFADVFGQYFIAYPAALGWGLAVLVIGAVFAMTATAIARGSANWRDVAKGAGAAIALPLCIATALLLLQRLIALLLSDIASPYAVTGQFAWILPATLLAGLGTGALMIDAAVRGRRWLPAIFVAVAGLLAALLGDFSPTALLLGLTAGALLLVSAGRPARLPGWFAGAASILGVAALALQIWLPMGAHALVWPLALLLPALGLLLFAPALVERPAALIILAAPAALLAGLMARTGYDLFVMMGVTAPAIMSPFLMLAALALALFLWPLRALPRVGMLLLVTGFIFGMAAGIKGQTPSATSPELVEVFRIADVDTGDMRWASGKLDKSGWVEATLSRDGGKPRLQSIAPLAKDDYWVAKAKPSPFVAPRLDVAVAGDGAARLITIRAANANAGRYMRIHFKPSVDLTGLQLMDTLVPGTLKAGEWSQVIFHASGSGEVHLTMHADGPGRMEVRMVEVRGGAPASGSLLPPHVFPYRRSGDSMIVTGRMTSW